MPSHTPRLTVLPDARAARRDRPTLLLTGGSGVLGRALIDELAADFDLLCLRRNTPLRDPRVRELEGDLVAPRLGLTPLAWHELALRVDVVVHSAAETNWRTPPEDIMRTNVRGADNVLDLAARADAPLYLVSTAFVANTPTDEDRARFPGAAAYLDSKSLAERMVREAGVPGGAGEGVAEQLRQGGPLQQRLPRPGQGLRCDGGPTGAFVTGVGCLAPCGHGRSPSLCAVAAVSVSSVLTLGRRPTPQAQHRPEARALS
ncbi:SDR family oxidoreductase [Streptomyces sp. BPPL-273]|uniref:SDR family oxidoreductase n=1 Tax=Streptomyces sp. BPPL-273 TaxID=2987533 RepID=UPI0024AECE0C|nr:SDR family oxidoreductase [Streptomyces sp. BPPL-273]WHM34142.1 SDR family oxidoreductase [Streptomyces sp. BPPL-273]